jgi:tripartite-type tricarboxylate transporter receptor subunit TctC
VHKLNAEMDSILRSPEVKELLARQGLAAAGGGPEKLTQMVKAELERWTRVIAEAKITRD